MKYTPKRMALCRLQQHKWNCSSFQEMKQTKHGRQIPQDPLMHVQATQKENFLEQDSRMGKVGMSRALINGPRLQLNEGKKYCAGCGYR